MEVGEERLGASAAALRDLGAAPSVVLSSAHVNTRNPSHERPGIALMSAEAALVPKNRQSALCLA
jgi:hypothetical protein